MDDEGEELPAVDDKAAAVKLLFSCIRTSECAWQTCVRCFKQLYSEREKDISDFVVQMYDVAEQEIRDCWAQLSFEGIQVGVESQHLKDFV